MFLFVNNFKMIGMLLNVVHYDYDPSKPMECRHFLRKALNETGY